MLLVDGDKRSINHTCDSIDGKALSPTKTFVLPMQWTASEWSFDFNGNLLGRPASHHLTIDCLLLLAKSNLPWTILPSSTILPSYHHTNLPILPSYHFNISPSHYLAHLTILQSCLSCHHHKTNSPIFRNICRGAVDKATPTMSRFSIYYSVTGILYSVSVLHSVRNCFRVGPACSPRYFLQLPS